VVNIDEGRSEEKAFGGLMKIAITADLHLTSKDEHPERYNALRNILDQMLEEHVGHLMIAGDLFETSLKNFSDYEALCTQKRYKGIRFSIIPGNHDADLSPSSIVAENVRVFNQPTILEVPPEDLCFFMVPYAEEMTMGDCLEVEAETLKERRWIMVGHGDWSEGLRQPNPYEPGVYMPLTNADIERYQPRRVFLGHIHAPMDRDRVHYAGSPCGLDITECGKRRFLLYDTEQDEVETRVVDTDVIYFDENFVMLPVEDEKAYITNLIRERIRSWDIAEEERNKVRVRVALRGYSADRKVLSESVDRALKGYAYYKDQPPDLSGVSISVHEDLRVIAERVKARILEMDWIEGFDEPSHDEILIAALHTIYGD
jgi:DNA repair exonuclease SbcCD nuclease subunit